MAEDHCFAGYPAAVVYDAPDGKGIHQYLWGRYIALTGQSREGWLEIKWGPSTRWVKKSAVQDEPILRIVFVDIGQGDGCIISTPDDKQIVVDAGEGDNMFRFLSDKFGDFQSTVKFESFVISHPDKDHYFGFTQLFDHPNVEVATVYHSGLVERAGTAKNDSLGQRGKIDNATAVTELIATKAELDALLTPTRIGGKPYPKMLRDALDSGRVGNVRMLNATDRHLPGYEPGNEIEIQVLGPVPETATNGNAALRWFEDVGKTKNGHSIILRLVYGKVSILLGGDLNTPSEQHLLRHYTQEELPPEDEERLLRKARKIFESDFAKCCHHGAADFTALFLKGVNAKATVISSGDNEKHAHPRADTLGTIGRHSRGKRPLIFSTELSRSARELVKRPSEFRENLKKRAEAVFKARQTGDETAIKKAETAFEDALKEIERSIATYGAINLCTDGKRAIVAYRIELRSKPDRVWDVYRFEPIDDTGAIEFIAQFD